MEYEWQKVTDSSSNVGGELQSSKYIDGYHGEYDLTRGHFFCFDPYAAAETVDEQQNRVISLLNENFARGMAGDEDPPERTRALIWQMNFYDLQSQIYTTATILFERSAAGLFSGTKIEILPYYMPLANQAEEPVTLVVIRILAVLWLLINTFITLSKRKFFEIFTVMTFWDTYLSMFVLGLQISNSYYIIHYNTSFIATPQGLLDPDIRSRFFLLRAFGYRWQLMMFIDSFTVLCLMANLLTMIRKSTAVDTILNSLQHAVEILVRGTLFWLLLNIGLCLFNMSLYGNQYQRYSDYLNAYISTLYSQAALAPQNEQLLTLSSFFFTLINNVFLYFLNTLFIGITLASI